MMDNLRMCYFTNNESIKRYVEFHHCDSATRKSNLECDNSGSCKEKPSRRAPDVVPVGERSTYSIAAGWNTIKNSEVVHSFSSNENQESGILFTLTDLIHSISPFSDAQGKGQMDLECDSTSTGRLHSHFNI
jgi:hypothetical protein